MKLMSAGRNDSDIRGDDSVPIEDEEGVPRVDEKVVVSMLDGGTTDVDEIFEFKGDKRRVCDTGRFSGVELRRERRVCDDEVVLGVLDTAVA